MLSKLGKWWKIIRTILEVTVALILGSGADGRPIHVVCSPRSGYLAIITAYIPSEEEWQDNFRKRKNS
jgi:hypothetical protein